MNNRRNGFAPAPIPTPGNLQNRYDHRARFTNNDGESSSSPPVLHRHPLFRSDYRIQRGLSGSRGAYEERVIRGPFSSDGFPAPPYHPQSIIIRENSLSREDNRRTRQTIPRSPPAFIPQQITSENNSRLAEDEQMKVLMTKLKKEIYNPGPKNLLKRLSLYYRDKNRGGTQNTNTRDIEDEDAKRCSVCLEDFEPGKPVMVTHCNHMFHEECIVPWVKSSGQCPVCRFVILEKKRETATGVDNGDIGSITANDLFAGELLSVIRAMEEAFLYGHALR